MPTKDTISTKRSSAERCVWIAGLAGIRVRQQEIKQRQLAAFRPNLDTHRPATAAISGAVSVATTQ